MNEKERITITIENLDDLKSVLGSIDLLFRKIIFYYSDKNFNNLVLFIISCAVWFGELMTKLGINADNYKDFLEEDK